MCTYIKVLNKGLISKLTLLGSTIQTKIYIHKYADKIKSTKRRKLKKRQDMSVKLTNIDIVIVPLFNKFDLNTFFVFCKSAQLGF